MQKNTRLLTTLMMFLLTAGLVHFAAAQDTEKRPKLNSESKQARFYALGMLDEIKKNLKEHYYDQKFGGMDLEKRIEEAKARVKTLEYNWQMYRVLAQLLVDLDDSHTYMILPSRRDHFRYGINWQMFGESCLVTQVRKDSDAFVKGLEVGDQVLAIRNFPPTRADLWKMEYVIYKLDPDQQMELKIRKPDQTEKTIVIKAKTLTDKELRAEIKARKERRKARKEKNEYQPFKCREVDSSLIGCRLSTFEVEKGDIDKMMKQVAKYPKFILDLRQNSGGYVHIEEYLLSHFFDKKVKIADMITKTKKLERNTDVLSESKRYKGEMAVLVDSESASAAEMTARVLQIEKRAQVFGDYSSGAVMTSITIPFVSMLGMNTSYAWNLFWMSVTIGDVVMSDGSRLEKTGVAPDYPLLPTPMALKQKMDPVFSIAAAKMGSTISPDVAGKFHFITSDSEDDEDVEEQGEDDNSNLGARSS